MRGAVIDTPQVTARIAGDLNIESLQDTSSFQSRSQNVGGSLTFGAGASVSANASRTRIDSDFASVAEQSGIRAGDGGSDIDVEGTTTLRGGAITSSEAAVQAGRNVFDTDELILEDIENRADYQGSSAGITLASSPDDKGERTPAGSGAGAGSDSGSARSVTRAAISGIAGDTAARTGDAQAGIAQIFDAERVQAEIDAQVEITQAFAAHAVQVGAEYAQTRAGQLRAEAAREPNPARQAELLAEAASWDEGGSSRSTLHAAIGGLTGGLAGAVGAAISAFAAPALEDLQQGITQALVNAGLNEEAATGAAQTVTAMTAGALSAAGSGSEAGAAAGLNVDANNRQLHASETRWIRENARRFAEREGISNEEAERRLGQQAFRQVQFGAAGDWDGNASAFLRQSGPQMLPADPATPEAGPGYMFYATPAQRANATMYLQQLQRSPELQDFAARNDIAQPTLEQIVQAAERDGHSRAVLRERTLQGAVVAGAIVLAPAVSGIATEAVAFARNPYAYCMVNPHACVVATEVAATTAADVPVSTVNLPAGGAVRVLTQEQRVAQDVAALRQVGARNTTLAAQMDHATISRAESNLYNQLADRARVGVDTSQDAFYIANTNRAVLSQHNFDMNYVLAGEINAAGRATGYHAEFAANGAARITPGAQVVRHPNGTYEAPVQVWDDARRQWIDKKRDSTFFPPDWSQARIEYEVSEAFRGGASRSRFEGTSPSGVRIQFNWDPRNSRTTFYPIGD